MLAPIVMHQRWRGLSLRTNLGKVEKGREGEVESINPDLLYLLSTQIQFGVLLHNHWKHEKLFRQGSYEKQTLSSSVPGLYLSHPADAVVSDRPIRHRHDSGNCHGPDRSNHFGRD